MMTYILFGMLLAIVGGRAVSDLWTRALRPLPARRESRPRFPRRRRPRELPPGDDDDRD